MHILTCTNTHEYIYIGANFPRGVGEDVLQVPYSRECSPPIYLYILDTQSQYWSIVLLAGSYLATSYMYISKERLLMMSPYPLPFVWYSGTWTGMHTLPKITVKHCLPYTRSTLSCANLYTVSLYIYTNIHVYYILAGICTAVPLHWD